MKIRAFLPALIALIILTGSPFSTLLNITAKPHGGLVCYCCKDASTPCVMISCNCCQDKPGLEIPRWMPEIIFDSHYPGISIKPAYTEIPGCIMPESIYMDVPVKPPNRVQYPIAFI